MLAGNEKGLTQVAFQDGVNPLVPQPDWQRDDSRWATATSALLSTAVSQLTAYFAGERTQFDLPLAPKGTPFQQQVWAYLQTIPYGRTTTYGAIAEQLGNPKSSRAVGAANGRNPIAVIIPCHRVVGSSGKLTGYASGLKFKEALLGLERNGRIDTAQQLSLFS
ncbi:MAG: methylated-DNA--protein-cysteine methyltransferase [Ardenticatenaceae bacterium]|nr:MAG: methylated-DNA--protein-cysteine methyltransferase [Ardenticatenaceae bacterium]